MPLGGQLFIHLRAEAVHQHDLDPHGLDQRQVLRNVVQLAGGNGLTRQPDHKGLVAKLVDVGRHRPEPGHESEIENGRHGGGQEALEYAGAQTAKGDRLGRQVAHHKHAKR